MRLTLGLVSFIVLIWSAYWFLGAQKNKTRVTDWIFEQQDRGWFMEFDGLKQIGYPNRFDITLSNLDIRSPEGAISWQGSFLQNLRLSYKPNHSIIVFPKRHNFSLGKNVFNISNENARASVIKGAAQEYRIILELKSLEISNENFKIEIPKAQLAVLQEANQHKLHIKLVGRIDDHKAKMNTLTIAGDIEMPPIPNNFPIPVINGLGARFTNLKADIDSKNIITDGTITVAPDLKLNGQLFTSRNTKNGLDSQYSHLSHLKIKNTAAPLGVRVYQMP